MLDMTNANNRFFGENGVTSLRAYQVVNFAAKVAKAKSSRLEQLSYFDSSVTRGRSARVESMLAGMTTELGSELSRVEALIAYLRESFRAKASLCDEVNSMGLAAYRELMGATASEADLEAYRSQRLRAIAALTIALPDELKATFELMDKLRIKELKEKQKEARKQRA